MADRQNHRGPHPRDKDLFRAETIPDLRAAVEDYSHLMTRGYAVPSTLKLVGDRYQLRARQRTAMARIACGEKQRIDRSGRAVSSGGIRGRDLHIDGFNVLTTIEAALAGGILLATQDGCIRDMASMHGSYRILEDTRPAIELLVSMLEELSPRRACWYLDRPVSNSGRLRSLLQEMTAGRIVSTTVEVVPDPDEVLSRLEDDEAVVATADSGILDRCGSWFSLARFVIEGSIPQAEVLRL